MFHVPYRQSSINVPTDAIRVQPANSFWVPTASAAQRSSAQFHVDGKSALAAMAGAISAAKERIWITDWQLTPSLLLTRDAAPIGLSGILKERASNGVVVHVILWDSTDLWGYLQDNKDIDAEKALENLDHKNIHVLRHTPTDEGIAQLPDDALAALVEAAAEEAGPVLAKLIGKAAGDAGLMRWLLDGYLGFRWSHHQKTLVVDPTSPDRCVAFLGGVDLCLGRWDEPGHPLRKIGEAWPYDPYNPCAPPESKKEPDQPNRAWPRMPWHDVHMEIHGPCAYEVAQNFLERWTNTHSSRVGEAEEALDVQLSSPKPAGDNVVQVVRSLSPGSGGHRLETGVAEAYHRLIMNSQYLLYIENQYFISNCPANEKVQNLVAEALVSRIRLAIRQKSPYHAFIVVPMHPEGRLLWASGPLQRSSVMGALRLQLQTFRYMHSAIAEVVGEDRVSEYLSIYFLCTATDYLCEQIYVHAKLMIADDLVAVVGSANINDRSLLGERDSEIAGIVTDTGRQKGTLANAVRNVCPSVRKLRQDLMKEHFGVEVEDPVVEAAQLRTLAKAHERALRASFPWLPGDEHATLMSMLALMAASKPFSMSTACRAVPYPIHWLRDEPMSTYEKLLYATYVTAAKDAPQVHVG